MIVERIYKPWDLKHGICEWCNEESDEILIDEDVCVDCWEGELFYKETMKGI